ncbi:hypothetical protein BDP27DRAFT_1360323 [Rhodocollybia butyracea]|uniref:Uncharacterized protein n=1 Tax=Rhodocollybia butyracea TaxID=206335 RepID=A0A9P5UBS8_9AGAR|nr:hypothetical protein BDP27DRAFT_1360323 [Rhodocollybia butyracea]
MAPRKYLIPPPIPTETLNRLQRFMPTNIHQTVYGSQTFSFATSPLPQSNISLLPPLKPPHVSPVELATINTTSEVIPSWHLPDVPVAIVAIDVPVAIVTSVTSEADVPAAIVAIPGSYKYDCLSSKWTLE